MSPTIYVSAFLLLTCTVVLSEITLARFEEFRAEIVELVNCNVIEEKPECKGLLSGPLITGHDIAEVGRPIGALAAALLRLTFHDCIAVDPNKIKTGDSDFFTDPQENGFAGGCNGCIGIDTNANNDPLLQAAIEPIELICEEFYIEDGLSRADCWALAGTIAVETAAAVLNLHRSLFGITIDPAVIPGDIPYYIGRKDCKNNFNPHNPNSVEYEFSNPNGVSFQFPDPLQGWKHVLEYFQKRLSWNDNEFTLRDTIALISGGHSMGRAHVKASGFSGAWDFTPETLDGEFVSLMFNEDFSFTNFPLTIQNLHTNIRKPAESNALPQWSMKQSPALFGVFPFLLELDPPVTSLMMNFNTDISMIYDLSYYIETGKQLDIDCQTNAAALCDSDQIVLTAPRGSSSLYNQDKTGEELGEQYKCGRYQRCCQYKQCAIQCEGGLKEFNRLLNTDLNTLNDNVKCPAALAKRYSNQFQSDWRISNRNLGVDFARAFTKMITIGYTDGDGDMLLKVIGQSDSDSAGSESDSFDSDSEDGSQSDASG